MKKILKKNAVFIIIFCIAIICIVSRNRYEQMPVVSTPNSELVFSTEDSVLEQTWQPQVKRIAGVKIPYVSTDDFESNMKLTIYSDDYAEVIATSELYQTFQTNEKGVLSFSFPIVRVLPGERYRICLSYDTFSTEGAISVQSGSNYDGCSIGEQRCGEAAALYITVIKNSFPFRIFSIFFPLASFALLFMIVWNRKWEECIGIAVIITGFILYVAGLLEMLKVGMALVYILAFLAFLFSIYIYQKKDFRFKDLCSPAFIIYIVFFVAILLNCHNVWFARWDEYYHWGLATKDMFYFDSLAKHINTTVVLPRYCPFSTLIEYFFVYAEDFFSPDMVYIAFQTIMLSLLMVVCGAIGQKKKYLLPSIAIMFIVPLIFFEDAYNCIYVDPLMAVLAAYVLICYFTEELAGFNFVRILGALFALTMTKDMGFVIAGLLSAVMMADTLYQVCRRNDRERKGWRCLLRPLLCAIVVLAVFISWQVYISIPARDKASEIAVTANQEEADEMDGADAAGPKEVYFQGTVSASRLSLQDILKLFRHEDDGYRYQAIKNYLTAIFDEETFRFGSIWISYVDAYILILLLIGALGLFEFWGKKKEQMWSFGFFTFLAGMGYSFVLELMYLFAFPQGEALILSSHRRYHGSFLGAVVLALLCLIIQQAAKREEENVSKAKKQSDCVAVALIAFLIICMPMEGLMEKNMDQEITEADIYGYADMAEALRSFAEKSEKIYFIKNDEYGTNYCLFRYAVSPLICIEYNMWDIYASEEIYEEEMEARLEAGGEVFGNEQILSCEEWEKILQEVQYVFLMDTNDAFAESYGELFAEPDTIGERTFYRVRLDNGDVKLDYIGQVGVKD